MIIYVVRAGDTVSSISRQFGISPARLQSDNGIEPGQRLVVGQALIVLIPRQTYTVNSGDTLYGIAERYGTSVISLQQNNPTLATNPQLYDGRVLTISFESEKRRPIIVNGYSYEFINRSVLLRALPFLTYLSVFSYGFDENGDLIPVEDDELIRLAYEFRASPIMVLTTIDKLGRFSTRKSTELLNDTAYQNRVLTNIIETMRQKGYVGLDIDFEFIAREDAAAYFDFLRNASRQLKENGFILTTVLAPKTYAEQPGLLYEAHDYRAIGEIADLSLIMTYEWGYTYGPPMAVAPINQVRKVVQYAVTEINPTRILLGVPNYGYDWTLPYIKGSSEAQSIGNQQAVLIASRNNSSISFDEDAQSPYFEYSAAGRGHVVWFEDVRSIDRKFLLADEFSLVGTGYWNVMRPFAQNWAYLSANYDIIKYV